VLADGKTFLHFSPFWGQVRSVWKKMKLLEILPYLLVCFHLPHLDFVCRPCWFGILGGGAASDGTAAGTGSGILSKCVPDFIPHTWMPLVQVIQHVFQEMVRHPEQKALSHLCHLLAAQKSGTQKPTLATPDLHFFSCSL